MPGISCIIDFSDQKLNVNVRQENIKFSDRSVQLIVDEEFFGKYYWHQEKDTFILLMGSAFFHADIDGKRSLITDDNLSALLKAIKESDHIDGLLTGYYNLVIVNENSREAVVHNSHFGMRPVFYYHRSNQLVIATQPDAIVNLDLFPARINESAAYQFILFNYSLTDETLYNDIFSVPGGCQLVYRNGETEIVRYFNARDLIDQPEMGKKESMEYLYDTFASVIEKYTHKLSGFSLSLTGGWDGRLILAFLKNYNVDISSYSHGSRNNPDVIIPQGIAKTLGIDYTPYFLDQDYYSDHFYPLARQTVENSAGMRSLTRAHYLYSVGSELKKTAYVITGICGSNVMKGNIVPGPVSNAHMLDFAFQEDFDAFWSKVEEKIYHQIGLYINVNRTAIDKLKESLKEKYLYYHSSKTYEVRLYHLILSDVERGYFGNEISTYRHLGENLSPFIDIDFIRSLVKTPFFGAYISSNKKNIFANWKGSLLYAYMINKSYPALGKIKSDKGVSLDEIAKLHKWPRVIIKQLKRKYFSSSPVYYDHSTGLENIFLRIANNGLLKRDIKELQNLKRDESLNNLVSFLYWSSLKTDHNIKK